MGKARFFSIATATIVALSLGAATGADAAQRGGDLCVAVSGGVVENATVLDVVADGGTGIGDASGGTGNLAIAADGGNENERNNGNNNGNNNNNNGNGNNNDRDGNGNNDNGNGNGNNGNGNNDNDNGNGNNGNGNGNRNDWSAESLQTLELRLEQTDTASAGNAGVATASADGGAVSIQDINSGGNAGNAIAIGDTVCPGAAHAPAAAKDHGAKAPAGNVGGGGGGGRGGQVRALPSTGIGLAETGASASLLLALGALGFMGLSLGSRLDRRVSSIAGR